MTPQEKATELVEKFSKLMNYGLYALPLCEYTAKQCALIAVEKIKKANPFIQITYWNEVKAEIEKL